jgi:DNA adenine methylase
LLTGDSCGVDFERSGIGRTIGARPRPFVKWAGGKRRLLEQYNPYLPSSDQFRCYFEPFLGGGALFFHLRPKRAVLADLNSELINCYQTVKERPEELIACLRKHKATERYFYKMREMDPQKLSTIDRASRFIYLNKTCYNGLYRVNSKGQFNVPFGRYKHPLICDEEAILGASLALQQVQLKVNSFEKTVQQARSGDFVYFDPPYVPLTSTSSFTSYTAVNFGEQKQAALAETVRSLNSRGCLVLVSNSDTKLVRELYRGFVIETVRCSRSINSIGTGRSAIAELIIKNYE